tara:strand:+ start:2431 stop:2682 length:252 start_codon:yes stop_codon:yes gene_type:complete
MKKKNLLQDWENTQREYYEQFNRSQIEALYSEWFSNDIDHYPYMEKYQMIDELIDDEFTHRKQDSIEDLTDTIKHLNKLTLNK